MGAWIEVENRGFLSHDAPRASPLVGAQVHNRSYPDAGILDHPVILQARETVGIKWQELKAKAISIKISQVSFQESIRTGINTRGVIPQVKVPSSGVHEERVLADGRSRFQTGIIDV
jgi:hypothetical protein